MGTLIADDWGCDYVPGHTDSIRHFLFEELIVNYYIILGVHTPPWELCLSSQQQRKDNV